MNSPITAPAPVNPIISLQPLTSAIPQHNDTPANPLANLPPGTVVQGFVVNRDGQNNPILRTPEGDVLVKSDVFIKTGSEVVFRVDPTQSSRARIITIDGLSLQDYSTQNTTRVITADTIAPTTLQAAVQTASNASAATVVGDAIAKNAVFTLPVLEAVVLSPTHITPQSASINSAAAALITSEAVPPQLAQLAPGTGITLTIVNVQLPPTPIPLASIPDAVLPPTLLPPGPTQTQATAAPQLSQPIPTDALIRPTPPTQVPLPQNPATTIASPVPPTSLAQVAIPQNNFASAEEILSSFAPESLPTPPALAPKLAYTTSSTLAPLLNTTSYNESSYAKPAANAYAQAAEPTKASPANAPQLHAVVIGHEADGANILQTKFATLKLYTPQPLPVGTSFTVQAEVKTGHSAPSITTLSNELENITTLTRDLQHLGDALNALQATDPALARQIIQQMPAMGPKLTSGMLFFFAAVKGGNVKDWLGNRAIGQLESAAPGLLARLRQDMAQMQEFYNNSPLTNWSGIMLPMMVGNELQQARIYIRKDEEHAGSDGATGKGHRFIIEVDLSQLGDMQFDGFVREGGKSKSFDLIVRTAKPLPSPIANGIRDAFTSAMQTTGIAGQLVFQQGVQHFIRPLAGAQTAQTGESPHTILA